MDYNAYLSVNAVNIFVFYSTDTQTMDCNAYLSVRTVNIFAAKIFTALTLKRKKVTFNFNVKAVNIFAAKMFTALTFK